MKTASLLVLLPLFYIPVVSNATDDASTGTRDVSESMAMQIAPPADTIFVGGGCTPALFSWHQSDTAYAIDSLIITPGFNTTIWTGDSLYPRTYWYQITITIPDSARELTYVLASSDRKAMPLPVWDAFVQDSLTEFGGCRTLRIIALRNGVPVDTARLILISLIGLSVPDENGTPSTFALEQNYPNPFNPSTTIRFSIPVRSKVRLTILDLLGREVAELVNGEMEAGIVERVWKPEVSSGVYFYRIEAFPVAGTGNRFVEVKKMLLLR